MSEQYFRNHYAHINNIDPDSESSFREWLERARTGYHREFGSILPDIAGKKILEIGCGLGGTIYYLQSRGGSDIIGVDKSDDQLSLCRKYISKNVVTSDALHFLESTGDKYDIIIALDLIEHLSKPSIIPFLKAARQRLTEGGMLILRTPNMGSLFGLRSRYIDFTHETGFTEESMFQVMRESGFQTITVRNAYIGKWRAGVLRMVQGVLSWLYNIPLSRILTSNLIAIGSKQHYDSRTSL